MNQRQRANQSRHNSPTMPMKTSPITCWTSRITSSSGIRSSAKKVYTAADDPKNLVALDAKMHQSIDAFERHQLDRALQLARELVDARPDMSVGRETYAFMLEANDRVPEAIHQLEIVVRSDAAGTNADDPVS